MFAWSQKYRKLGGEGHMDINNEKCVMVIDENLPLGIFVKIILKTLLTLSERHSLQ